MTLFLLVIPWILTPGNLCLHFSSAFFFLECRELNPHQHSLRRVDQISHIIGFVVVVAVCFLFTCLFCLCTKVCSTTLSLILLFPFENVQFLPSLSLPTFYLDFWNKLLPKTGKLRCDICSMTREKSFSACSSVTAQLSFAVSWICSLDLCLTWGFWG